MEVQDVHIGKQLQVNFSPAGSVPIPCAAYLTGAAAIPGTGFFNGSVMVGSPVLFPIHTASLQVTRPDPVSNPLAFKAPSIVHIRGLPPPASTPIDVVIGDPLGPVGITMATTIVLEINAVSKKTISPLDINIIALMKKLGVQVDTGATVETGAQAQAGAEARASVKAIAGAMAVAGPLTAASVSAGPHVLAAKKNFDIQHPNKEGWRLRHTCVEGPESAVYIRGKLDGEHIIKLPEYWKGLIDYDTISVNLTPFGRKDNLYVKDIQEDRIIIAGDHLTNVKCFYQIWADRLGKLIVEYEGLTPDNYPGDNSEYNINT
jgi:hypothetical protein|tara:strand:+ start:865 stop:1818 length:954 start_codon:yes stop_codon:yes gene_type:complete